MNLKEIRKLLNAYARAEQAAAQLPWLFKDVLRLIPTAELETPAVLKLQAERDQALKEAQEVPALLGDRVRLREECAKLKEELSRACEPRMECAHGPSCTLHLSEVERALIAYGSKIPAIKQVRTRTGLGLKEAKEVVDGWTAAGNK